MNGWGSPRAKGLGTVRSKLTFLATAVVLAVLVVSSIGLVVMQQRLLTRGIDEALVQRADNIEGDISGGAFTSEVSGEGDPEDTFTQIIGESGEVVGASPNASTLTPAHVPLPPGSEQVIQTVSEFRGDDDFRVLARPVDSATEPTTLVIAKNLDDVHESVRVLATSLALSIPVVTLLLAVLVWWLTGRVLRPVESIRTEVAGIGGSELDRRVPVPGSHDEISRLAHTMNEMLDRVEQATAGQRRFVADASHELRGPLTRIRSTLEIASAHPETVDPSELYPSLLADTVDLNNLVDDLLFLARSESGVFERSTTPVNLDDLVFEEARRLRERGRVQVSTAKVSAARALGDPHQLARAIRNLAGNAERHATTSITFELRENAELSELVVADDGPGIPPEHHRTVFQRFTRLDEARSRDDGGSGLGLSIVQDIVDRHGGAIAIAESTGSGARFLLTLPRAD